MQTYTAKGRSVFVDGQKTPGGFPLRVCQVSKDCPKPEAMAQRIAALLTSSEGGKPAPKPAAALMSWQSASGPELY